MTCVLPSLRRLQTQNPPTNLLKSQPNKNTTSCKANFRATTATATTTRIPRTAEVPRNGNKSSRSSNHSVGSKLVQQHKATKKMFMCSCVRVFVCSCVRVLAGGWRLAATATAEFERRTRWNADRIEGFISATKQWAVAYGNGTRQRSWATGRH